MSQTQELEESVRRYALTGLYNRGYLDNDTYGHQVGDQILAATANILKASMWSNDIVAYYGGEGFIFGTQGRSNRLSIIGSPEALHF